MFLLNIPKILTSYEAFGRIGDSWYSYTLVGIKDS